MYYIVKITNYDKLGFTNTHGKYLYKGDIYFEYTSDIYKARNFKSISAAQKRADDIHNHDIKYGCFVPREAKVVGIELKEVEL